MPEPDEEGLLPMIRGQVEPSDWSAIDVGHIVQDKKDRMHTVLDVSPDKTMIKLKAARTGEEVVMRRPAGEVNIYVPSEQECYGLLHADLGASYLRDIEHREHIVAKALLWRMDPIPNNPTALRDHIDMAHQVYVNDVLGRYTSGAEQLKGIDPEKKKKGARKKKASLEELRAAHDEFHSDPHLWPQAIVHHHAKET